MYNALYDMASIISRALLGGAAENGLNQVPKDFAIFKASSEMTNGRAAMVGLVSLLLVEKFTNGALF